MHYGFYLGKRVLLINKLQRMLEAELSAGEETYK